MCERGAQKKNLEKEEARAGPYFFTMGLLRCSILIYVDGWARTHSL